MNQLTYLFTGRPHPLPEYREPPKPPAVLGRSEAQRMVTERIKGERQAEAEQRIQQMLTIVRDAGTAGITVKQLQEVVPHHLNSIQRILRAMRERKLVVSLYDAKLCKGGMANRWVAK
jgi:hypothetical protein